METKGIHDSSTERRISRLIAITACAAILGVASNAMGLPFHCDVIITRDHYVEDKWDNSPSAEGVRFSRASKFYRDESMHILVVMSGMARNSLRSCDVTFDLRITGPSGSEPTELKDLLAKRDVVAAPDNVYLADSLIEIVFDETDPFGSYSVSVVVHDRIAEKDHNASTTFQLVEYGSDLPSQSRDIEDRFQRYYENPNSHRLFELMRIAVDLEADGMPLTLGPFFRVILHDNPYQHAHVIPFLKSLTEEQRLHLVPMLKGVFEDHPAWIGELPESNRVREILARTNYPDIWDDVFTSPQELDMLWCHFFATGEIRPIRQLASAMALAEASDSSQLIIGGAATWSIRSNCEQHPLVLAYCKYLADSETSLSDAVRAKLRSFTLKPAQSGSSK